MMKQLPHYSEINSYQFVTFRTLDSVDDFLLRLKALDLEESHKQMKIDKYLDGSNIYRKRCTFVHKGDRTTIEIADLLFSDVLLKKVLMNIVIHPKQFNSKARLIKYSEKIQAEKLLGIKSKVRPNTIRASFPIFNEIAYKKI